MKKKLIICHWSPIHDSKIAYKHNQEFKYSKTKRNKLTNEILNSGYHILVKETDDLCTIWVDFYANPFRQR